MRFPKLNDSRHGHTQHEVLTEGAQHESSAGCDRNFDGRHANVSVDGLLSGFYDKAVPIVGSPQLAPYDLILWQAQVDAIMNDRGWNNGTTLRILHAPPGGVQRRAAHYSENYIQAHDAPSALRRTGKRKDAELASMPTIDSQAQAMMALDVPGPSSARWNARRRLSKPRVDHCR